MSDEKQPLPSGEFGDQNASLNPGKETDGAVPNEQEIDPAYDPAKVKFLNGEAQEVRVDVPDKDTEFVGLSKEELQKFATDPYWVKVRWTMLVLFWVAWFGMLIAAVLIIVFAPKCPPRQNLEWHEKGVMYDVYTRSFQDTNGDGVGDIKGIEKHVPYLRKYLNITGLLVGPLFASPMYDFGYDVSNYKELAPEYGTLADLKSLKTALHKRDMKLILDFVPNHTSKNCSWFEKSRNREAPYTDYYIWRAGQPGNPPNNWLSVFGGSAWTYDDVRKEYYLHQFMPEQPELNLTHPSVMTEMEEILKYWMAQGADGFRVDAAAHLVEDMEFRDEPVRQDGSATATEYDYLDHVYTTFQPGSFELITNWRRIIDQYDEETKRVLIVESYGAPNKTANFFEYRGQAGAHMPTNNILLGMKKGCDGLCVRDLLKEWMDNTPTKFRSNWALGNHDYSRVGTRMGERMVNAMNMLQLTLPGTPVTYYGEEIGMVDGDIAWKDTKDPAGKILGEANYKKGSRDPERTPMQWDDSQYAGFTELNGNVSAPWLPVNPDHYVRNVEAQRADGAGHTNVEVYAHLSALRQQPSFQWGSFHFAHTSNTILSYVRQAKGFDSYLVAINFGPRATTDNFQSSLDNIIPSKAVIAATTANFDGSYDRYHDFKVGNTMSLTKVHLRPGEGVVFKWAHDAVENEKNSKQ